MYNRVIYENWSDWVPFVAFGVTAGIFLIFVVRAMTMRKGSADQLSQLPLDKDF